ncbi:MAG: GGDEF domain-containing protein [Hyphomonas sp.]|uniref:GGDEF domain-containing protein n=1 Tax=Hyphomonas sp. TaxID=87 RepID=UPI003527FA55
MRAGLVALVSILASYILTAASIFVSPIEGDDVAEFIVPSFVIATIVPLLVATPVSLIIQRQQIRLSAALVALEEANAEIAYRARMDGMTRILKRDAFLEDMSALQAKGLRGAMLMIDVDHFKSINDAFGHHAGDEALILVAAAIRSVVREQDLAGRLGGEEFSVFLKDADLTLAGQIAERIRVAISEVRFSPCVGVKRQITASIGVAIAEDDLELDDLLRVADHCLYASKESGRNRVTTSETHWKLA